MQDKNTIYKIIVVIYSFSIMCKFTHVKKFKIVILYWNLYILYKIYNFLINNRSFSNKNLLLLVARQTHINILFPSHNESHI